MEEDLECPVCLDIFGINQSHIKAPKVLKCGDTICKECLVTKLENSKEQFFLCPLCREKFKGDDIRIDLIATNIINDLEIYCINLGCPWKGKLKDFSCHLQNCYFNPNEVPEYIKEVLNNKNEQNKENSEKKNDNNSDSEDSPDNNLTSFNTKSSLRARLYNRNRELVKNVFAKNNEVSKKESNLLNILKENDIFL